jgi:hypothetical protein
VRKKKRVIDETQELPVVDPSVFASVAAGDADDAVVDEDPEDFLPPPRQRLGKTTLVLSAVVLLGGGVLVGIAVQKHHGTTARATSRFGNFSARNASGSFPGGGSFPNFGANAATNGTGTANSGTGSTGTGSTSASGVPAVIGTIAKVTANTIVVKNFGGKEITVQLTDKTAVSNATPTSGLKAGETVTVQGTTSGGTVTATAVSAK